MKSVRTHDTIAKGWYELYLLMTTDDARRKIIEAIKHIYEPNEASGIADLLLEYITKLPKEQRIINKSKILPAPQQKLILRSLTRLQQHEPIQYLINESWFAGMRFYVDRNVLIPRPETEELVEWIVNEFKIQNSKFKILDIGTGSGCIAIALKKKMPGIEMWACDISDEALNVARINADALGATIDFVPMDFLDADQRKQLPVVDVIVSNPPYIPKNETKEMKKNVVEFEPSTALLVPDNDPIIFYKAIAEFGREKLSKAGSIYAEVHENYGQQVKDLFLSKGYQTIQVKKDLQGKDRMIKASIDP